MERFDAQANGFGLPGKDSNDGLLQVFSFARHMLTTLSHSHDPNYNYLNDVDLLRRQNEELRAQLAILERMINEDL